MRTSQIAHEPRTFHSGPYLKTLFREAERMDKQLQADICARIKQARIEAGFTQAEAADTLGVTLRAYQNYESVRVPFRSLSRMAAVFDVPERWLLHGEREVAEDGLALIASRLQSLEGLVAESVALTREALELLREAGKPAVVAPRPRKRA